jgi:hypothetical protein
MVTPSAGVEPLLILVAIKIQGIVMTSSRATTKQRLLDAFSALEEPQSEQCCTKDCQVNSIPWLPNCFDN